MGKVRLVALAPLALLTWLTGCGEKFSSAHSTPDEGVAGATAGASDSGGSASGTSSSSGGDSGGGSGGGAAGDSSGGRAGTAAGGDPQQGGDGGAGGDGSEEPPVPTEGLELWLRPERGLSAPGGAVSIWKDASSHARDALQTALNYRPQLVDGALSGKSALVFDGLDDYLKLPPLEVSFGSGLSLFLVMQQDAFNECEGFFEASNAAETDDIHFGDWNGSLLFEVEEQWINDTDYPLLIGAPEVVAVLQQGSGLSQVRRNSNGVGEGSVELPGSVTREQVFLGKSLYDCAPFSGRIGEVLLYSRALSDGELLQVEQYLQRSWGCCDQ